MRIGVCTGGGDCPGLNAAIRAIVKHAIGLGHEVIAIKDSFNGLMHRPLGVWDLSLDSVTDILLRGGTITGTTNSGNPFREDNDRSYLVIEGYKELKLDCVIAIGGDGTQTIADQFSRLGLNMIGVPKTIDNDLAATDISIGFQTSVNIAAEAIDRLKSTAESHERIMVLEVMGRDAGYIALHAGIAGGANVVLIPEIPFDYDSVIAKIKERRKMNRYFSIVVVAEGAFEKGGSPVFKGTPSSTRTGGSVNLGGIGERVAYQLTEKTGMESRVTVLGHVQRGGTPSAFDRVLATRFGVEAVDLAHKGKFGYVVGLKKGEIYHAPYADVAGIATPLPIDDPMIHCAEAVGINLGR